MKIVILGGTGFVGSHLKPFLQSKGHDVTVHGRQVFNSVDALKVSLQRMDVCVMLAGANVGERWTKIHKQALWDSRIQTNQLLKEALLSLGDNAPRMISASAIGIYPERPCGQPLDENSTEHGEHILAQLGRDWEEVSRALQPEPVILRFGVVLGRDGGALQKMLPAFKMGLGGPVAGGQQCFSWVHVDDLVKAIEFVIQRPGLHGAYNVTAPNPVTNMEFGQTLATVLHRPFLLPMPECMLKVIFGEGAQVLTHSACVVPTRLQQAGFVFDYPQVEVALKNLLV